MGAAASMQEFSSLTEKQQKELTAKFEALKADGKTEEEAVEIIKKLAQYRTIELTELLDVIGEIVAKGKTPLIVDNSEDDKVNTFYRYRTVQLIDGKKMGLDKSMKNVPVADIMEEKRKQLVTALKFGTPVIIALTKAVTDFVGTFNDASAAEKFNLPTGEGAFFPLDVFEGGGKHLLEQEHLDKLFRADDRDQGHAIARDPQNFYVAVTTQFAPEDFEEYLFGNADFGFGPAMKDKFECVVIKPVD
jgi:hypothetical protein